LSGSKEYQVSTYSKALNTISTKLGKTVTTHQGGVAYEIDALKRARRFLILGSAGGSFYVDECKLTLENAKAITDALDEHGVKVIDLITEISEGGLAPKQSPVLFALAIAAAHQDATVRKAALAAIARVCRTGTMLFEFLTYVQEMRGWGRGLRNAIGNWYLQPDVQSLAYQAIKYRQRNGWTHADALRIAHPRTDDPLRNIVFKWIVDVVLPDGEEIPAELRQLYGFQTVQQTTDKGQLLALIRDLKLPREALPTEWLNDKDVWEALLQDMPLIAMIRNLGVMTSIGLLERKSFMSRVGLSGRKDSDATALVTQRLGDPDVLRRSRVHPMAILIALETYRRGKGVRGSKSWQPVPQVLDALDAAFYLSFGNVASTQRDILLAVDVSGSMSAAVHGIPYIECRRAAAAMAMITAATEPNAEIIAFSDRLFYPAVSGKQRLDDVVRAFQQGGGTNCVLPIQHAIDKRRRYDAILTYTDSENGGGSVYVALDRYREQMNPITKFGTIALAANQFSLARPGDEHAIDVVGFDASAPQVLSGFIRGEI
jgi:60 kDa SS-A/Ro ribonucleoprotein